jgi:hypothetical protein
MSAQGHRMTKPHNPTRRTTSTHHPSTAAVPITGRVDPMMETRLAHPPRAPRWKTRLAIVATVAGAGHTTRGADNPAQLPALAVVVLALVALVTLLALVALVALARPR